MRRRSLQMASVVARIVEATVVVVLYRRASFGVRIDARMVVSNLSVLTRVSFTNVSSQTAADTLTTRFRHKTVSLVLRSLIVRSLVLRLVTADMAPSAHIVSSPPITTGHIRTNASLQRIANTSIPVVISRMVNRCRHCPHSAATVSHGRRARRACGTRHPAVA